MNVLKIKDTSALEPTSGAFKYYAPGIGLIFEEELALPSEEVALVVELQNIRNVENSAAIDDAGLGFEGDGSNKTITFLTEDANVNGAIGAYLYNTAIGEIGEGRILFADTEHIASGESVTMNVPAGMSLGLFLVADVEDLGHDLEGYMIGGLFFANMASGNVAEIYDGDPATTYTPAPANINDGLSPLVTDANGNILPIRAFHAVGNRGDFNFLNHVAGKNAILDGAGNLVAGIDVIGFEDGLASTADHDADFDDAFVAVSDTRLSDQNLETLLEAIDISRTVGTDGDDNIKGTDDDDQLIGLEGDDFLRGGKDEDIIEASGGDDRAHGGKGDDESSGEGGDDRLFGDPGDDEIDGGEGDDRLFGGTGDDGIGSGEGDDWLFGGAGHDVLRGGADDDTLIGGGGGARMAGGEDDDELFGSSGAADTFVFDLSDFGDDVAFGFENGSDNFEIATYTRVTQFSDVAVSEVNGAAMLTFAAGTVIVEGVAAADIDAFDFAFV